MANEQAPLPLDPFVAFVPCVYPLFFRFIGCHSLDPAMHTAIVT